MEGEKREKHENEGFLWGIKGVKMRLVLEVEGGEKWPKQQYFHLWNNRILEYRMGTVVKIWTKA